MSNNKNINLRLSEFFEQIVFFVLPFSIPKLAMSGGFCYFDTAIAKSTNTYDAFIKAGVASATQACSFDLLLAIHAFICFGGFLYFGPAIRERAVARQIAKSGSYNGLGQHLALISIVFCISLGIVGAVDLSIGGRGLQNGNNWFNAKNILLLMYGCCFIVTTAAMTISICIEKIKEDINKSVPS